MKPTPSSSFLLILLLQTTSSAALKPGATSTMVFREYIGSQFTNVSFTDVPINSSIPFHFILAFATDYTSTTSPTPTNGNFTPFWDTSSLSPSAVSRLKTHHSNVRVSLSLGGATVGDQDVTFRPVSVGSWVANAVSSLKHIIQEYNLDGIDIDYENFDSDPDTFAECMGRLIKILKKDGVISTASIAPYADGEVQRQYTQLWNKYGRLIDYVNFQFYAYDNSTTSAEFIGYFEEQKVRYKGGRVLASFISDWSKGLTAKNGFFSACGELMKRKLLDGIFVWCADDSKKFGFRYEIQSQNLLAGSL